MKRGHKRVWKRVRTGKRKRGTGKQDYLRVIFELDRFDGKGVKSTDIARKLGVSKPSVSEMLRKLKKDGFIDFKKYSKIFLTRKGKNLGEKISEKKEVIKSFFRKLGIDEKEADRFEHDFSKESVGKLKGFVEGRIEREKPGYVG